MSETEREIASQPSCWERAQTLASEIASRLPAPRERVAAVGCGNSWFMAQAYAALRAGSGVGETDAFTASEFPPDRSYDRIVAISRSGTTTEVARLVEQVTAPTTAITAVAGTPIPDLATDAVVLDFADERSVVQTRFATTTLALLRAHTGQDLTAAIAQGEQAAVDDLAVDATAFDHFVFLGHGWTVGLANEAALKMREAAQAHTEAYPAMEYRHGPIGIADARSAVWFLTRPPASLPEEVAATGALVVAPTGDPMAELVRVQRLAVALAAANGLDPDRPRNLSRSVVLPQPPG